MEKVGRGDGIGVIEKPKKRVKKIKPPKKYAVILHNDDYTPMEFVVWILMEFFHKTEEEAIQLCLKYIKKVKVSPEFMTIKLQNRKFLRLLRVLKNTIFRYK